MNRILKTVLVLALLTACAPKKVGELSTPTAGPSAASSPTAQPSATASRQPPPTTLPSPTPARTSCQQAGGTLETRQVSDARLIRPLNYLVYLPPCYRTQPERAYPTLYLLHGLDYTDRQWVNLGVEQQADDLIRTGEITPMIIVMPWEQTGLDMDIAVAEVLVPAIDRDYRTIPDRAHRAIGGLSRGGGWALHIGIRRLDMFGTIGLHSPAVFGVDLAMLPTWVKRQAPDPPPRIWIDIGDHDSLLPTTKELAALLDKVPLHYIFLMDQGDHNDAYWSSHLVAYLRWYSSGW